MSPAISIIVCTMNRADRLRTTLNSMNQLDVPTGMDVEVVVVDNNSTDDTCEVVRSFGSSPMNVKYVSETRRGLSHARNTGMAHSLGDFLLWTDDDVLLPTAWISDMVTPLMSGEYHGTGGRVKMSPSLERPWMNRSHFIRLADTRFLPDDDPAMIGASMAFSRDVLKTIPAFDVDLGAGQPPAGEDTLFFSQMLVAGLKIAPVPHSIVEHHFSPDRLQYKFWLKNAVHSGLCAAYLDYHWRHKDTTHLREREMFWKLALAGFRATRKRQSPEDEGCMRAELRALGNITQYNSLRHLVSQPRKYDRLGFVKRTVLSE